MLVVMAIFFLTGWDEISCYTGFSYVIYYGILADVSSSTDFDHRCWVNSPYTMSSVSSGDLFFIISGGIADPVVQCGYDSSWGKDSNGFERDGEGPVIICFDYIYKRPWKTCP